MAVLSVPAGFLEPELIRKGHAAGVRVMLLLGGDFPALETGAGVLDTLLANLSTFSHQFGYDGLDIDWEYPSRQSGFWISSLGMRTINNQGAPPLEIPGAKPL